MPAPAAVHTSNSDDEENVDVMAPLLQEEITPAKKVAKKRRRAPVCSYKDEKENVIIFEHLLALPYPQFVVVCEEGRNLFTFEFCF